MCCLFTHGPMSGENKRGVYSTFDFTDPFVILTFLHLFMSPIYREGCRNVKGVFGGNTLTCVYVRCLLKSGMPEMERNTLIFQNALYKLCKSYDN